ncbi:hypothetical protein SE17_30645, partial [Kouleothrix aurantiaca]
MVEGGAPAALPAAVESEQAVLGSILRNREALTAVASVLTPDVFYQQRHADIYRAMLDLHARRMPPDLRTVAEALRQAGTLDRLGGLAYLAELADTPVTSYHIDAYVAPVIATARKRRLIAVGGQIAALGYGDRGPDAAEADAQALLTAASLQTHADDVLSGTDATLRSWDRMMGEHAPTTMTGWSRLDDWTGGLAGGDLMLIGARPGMGKTALAMSLMRYLCKSGQAVPLLFALEMSSDQIVHRFVAMETGVSVQALRKAVGLDERTLQQITTAHGVIGSWQWAVCDRSDLSPERVRVRTAKHIAEHPETVVIVDHLGLLGIDGKHENRTQDVASISLALKRLARENNIPVIALSQLNRAAETRGDKVPLAADLRDSGALEQDADVVAMLYREDFYTPTPDNRGRAELHIRKNRHGPTGPVHLRF